MYIGLYKTPNKTLSCLVLSWRRIFTTGLTIYIGVTLSIELLEWGRTFSDFWGQDNSSYLLANVPERLYCR